MADRTTARLRALGRVVELRGDTEVVERFLADLPFGVAVDGGDEAPAAVVEQRPGGVDVDGVPAVEGSGDPLPWAAQHVELALGEHAAGLVVVHAGAVAVDGRAVLVPGRTMAGKSTLTAALVRAGADYLSDEWALVRPDGTIEAWPRPVQLRLPGGVVRRAPVEELGGRVASGPCELGLVARVRHDDAGWDVERITPGQAFLDLADNAIAARSRPTEVLDHLHAALGRVPAGAVRGTRGEADDAARRLLDLLAELP